MVRSWKLLCPKRVGLRSRIKILCNGAAHFMHTQILVLTRRVYSNSSIPPSQYNDWEVISFKKLEEDDP